MSIVNTTLSMPPSLFTWKHIRGSSSFDGEGGNVGSHYSSKLLLTDFNPDKCNLANKALVTNNSDLGAKKEIRMHRIEKPATV